MDGFDFLKWQRGGSPDTLSQSDLNDWETNYGTVAPLSATSAAVPEPATWMMLMLGMGTMLSVRRTVVPKPIYVMRDASKTDRFWNDHHRAVLDAAKARRKALVDARV